MATTIQGYISDVTLPNSDQYPIRAAAIPYGEVDSTSTSTAYTATIPGIYSLVDGVTVMLKNGVVTSASGFTININNLGAKPVYSNMATGHGTTDPTRDTTIFNINYTMLLIYSTDIISGGGWICYRGYDANTTDLGNMTGTLEVTHGGTGGTTAAAARTNLGLGSAATYTAAASVGNNSNLPTGAAIQSYVTGLGYITSASVPSAATATPLMDGTGAIGTSGKWAKEDHVHPSDTAKVDATVTSSGTTTKVSNTGILAEVATDSGQVSTCARSNSQKAFISYTDNDSRVENAVEVSAAGAFISIYGSGGTTNNASFTLSGTTLKNLVTPTANGDAANKKYVDDGLSSKQATLVSGTNIKTINGTSLLGSGDITIGGTPSAIDSSTIHTKAVAGWGSVSIASGEGVQF